MRNEADMIKRRKTITQLVDERGYALVEDLCGILDVSAATIRGDLEALDKKGELIRLRGVALSHKFSREEKNHAFSGDNRAVLMSQRMTEEKRTIARLCANLFAAGDTVFLDTSNTNLMVAGAMVQAADKALTVISNSIDVIMVLTHGSHINAVLAGGDYERATNSLTGSLAVKSFDYFKADYAVITARGFHLDKGVGVYHSHNTVVRRAMLENAQRRVIVADHSKFNIPGVEILCGWQDVDFFISDCNPPEKYLNIMKKNNIEIITEEL